jgi:hypothetical protein
VPPSIQGRKTARSGGIQMLCCSIRHAMAPFRGLPHTTGSAGGFDWVRLAQLPLVPRLSGLVPPPAPPGQLGSFCTIAPRPPGTVPRHCRELASFRIFRPSGPWLRPSRANWVRFAHLPPSHVPRASSHAASPRIGFVWRICPPGNADLPIGILAGIGFARTRAPPASPGIGFVLHISLSGAATDRANRLCFPKRGIEAMSHGSSPPGHREPITAFGRSQD